MNYLTKMRWKVLWLSVTVAAVASALHLEVDVARTPTVLPNLPVKDDPTREILPDNELGSLESSAVNPDANSVSAQSNEENSDTSNNTSNASDQEVSAASDSVDQGSENNSDRETGNGSDQNQSTGDEVDKDNQPDYSGDGITRDENQSESTSSNTSPEEDTSNSDVSEDVAKTSNEENPLDSRTLEVDRTGDREIVNTTYGQVQGHYKHLPLNILSYLDIPYGTLTGLFTAPSEPEPWDEIVAHEQHTKRCPQLEDGLLVGDTDCLTLSVFAPDDAENATVLFHVHDGDFTSGSADPSIYGPEHLASKGVILVLPNYRLGPLGFLCLQSEFAPGNAALKDLSLALSWTKQNIAAFGGDPYKIAVSGDGTAGALAGYLAISPTSREHISHVIVESGSVLAHWAIDRDPVASAVTLAKQVSSDSQSDIEFYNTADLTTVMHVAKDVKFKPCVETHDGSDAFITESPWKTLFSNETKIDISFMVGYANHAGMHRALSLSTEQLSSLNEDFSKVLPNDLKFENIDQMLKVAESLKDKYFGENDITAQNIDRLSRYYTDFSYLGPTILLARSLVNCGATVFLYEFSFLGDFNREHNALLSSIEGAARGDIVGYVFTQDAEMPAENTDEERVVNAVTDLWVSFINDGIPSTEAFKEWNELQAGEDSTEDFLSIGSEVTPQKGLHVDRMRTWSEVYEDHFIERNSAVTLQFGLIQLMFFVMWKLVLM